MAGSDDERNRGRMNDIDYYVIQRNIPYLCQQLRGDDIITHMFSSLILNRGDMDEIEIKQEKSPRKGMQAALNCMMESGGVNAFDPFIDCLNKSGYPHVVDKLKLDRQEKTAAMNIDTLLPSPNTTIPSNHAL